MGQSDRAIDTLLYAYPYNINDYSLHALLASLYYSKGDLLEARKELMIALIFKPSDPYLVEFLAKVNYKLSNYDEALENNLKLNELYSYTS